LVIAKGITKLKVDKKFFYCNRFCWLFRHLRKKTH